MKVTSILLLVLTGTVAAGNGLRMLVQPFLSPGSYGELIIFDLSWFYDWSLLTFFGVLTLCFGLYNFIGRCQAERCYRRLLEESERRSSFGPQLSRKRRRR